jgi:hypothetical protein
MDNRKLCALAAELSKKSSTEVDTILGQTYRDPQERLSVKIQIDAMDAPRRTVHARGLATDTAEVRPHLDPRTMGEMDRVLRRAGVDARRQYSEADLNALLAQAGVDAETKIACKLEAEARGLLRDTSRVERLLQSLSIDGPPVDQVWLEREMDRTGYGVTAQHVVKAELQMRGWLKSSGRRTMKASAAQGTRLVDARGRAITLRSRPE